MQIVINLIELQYNVSIFITIYNFLIILIRMIKIEPDRHRAKSDQPRISFEFKLMIEIGIKKKHILNEKLRFQCLR